MFCRFYKQDEHNVALLEQEKGIPFDALFPLYLYVRIK
jgi:hypothetical protein